MRLGDTPCFFFTRLRESLPSNLIRKYTTIAFYLLDLIYCGPRYRLVPMGSFSRIEKVTGDKAIYELYASLHLLAPITNLIKPLCLLRYGSGDFAVARILQNRRFDMAMVAFLDCLRQVMEFVKMNDRSLKLPHALVLLISCFR